MRLGLCFPQWTGAYGWIGYFARRNSTWPPLNLALLAACVDKAGHESFIVDGQVEGLTPKECAGRVLAEKPDVVGFTVCSPFFHVQLEVARLIKLRSPGTIIIMGGPHITIEGTKLTDPVIDHLFTGECEETLPAVLDQLEDGIRMPRVIGGKRVVSFDALPMPARDKLPMHRYRLGTLEGRQPFTSIQAKRGCPWSCHFCASDKLDTKSVFLRSPESVVAEMADTVKRFGIRHFYFVDDVLTLYPDQIRGICALIAENGLMVTFEGSTRANLLTPELVRTLKCAGLVRLSFGLESVNAHVRDLMKKKVPMQHYVTSNKLLNESGIEVLNSLMIGLPGDTRDTIEETISWVAGQRDIKQANLAIAVPYPGTEFHDMAVAGQHGVKLHTSDFSEYRRYGTAVTTVNGMTPIDLVRLQNEGFVRIYARPHRWASVYGKHGAIGVMLMLFRALKYAASRWTRSRAGHLGFPIAPNT